MDCVSNKAILQETNSLHANSFNELDFNNEELTNCDTNGIILTVHEISHLIMSSSDNDNGTVEIEKRIFFCC